MSAWFGIFAPRGTPREVVKFVNEKMQAVIDEPQAKQRFADLGAEPGGGAPEVVAERLRADHRMWGQVIKEAAIKLE